MFNPQPLRPIDADHPRLRRLPRWIVSALLATCVVPAGFAGLLAPTVASAATPSTWYVSNSATSNPSCGAASATVPFASIAAALGCAAAGDTVSLSSGTFSGGFSIPAGITLSGAGAAKTTIVGPANVQVAEITVNSVLPVTIANLTVNGLAPTGPLNHGIVAGKGTLTLDHIAVINTLDTGGSSPAAVSAGTTSGSTNLTILDSTISGNQGEGVEVDGAPTGAISDLTIVNSTIAGNSATIGSPLAGGVGLDNAQAILTNDTIAGNTGVLFGGIEAAGTSNVSMTNTLVARNSGTAEADCAAASDVAVTGDHNLIGADTPSTNSCNLVAGRDGNLVGTSTGPLNPKLNPLASNAAQTQTMSLQSGSPAISAGNAEGCGLPPLNGLDQRGVIRSATSRLSCDIGAYDTAGKLGKTWYVSATAATNPACAKASVSVPFHTIAAAVACSHNSDTVSVGSGTFAGGFTLTANVLLKGAGANKTTIGNHSLTYPKAEITVADRLQARVMGLSVDGTVGSRPTNPGIFSGSGQLTVTAVEVHGTLALAATDNGAISSSAGIGQNSDVTVLSSTVTGNSATFGSAIAVAAGPNTPVTSPSTLLVANSTITGNTSTFEAGGVSGVRTDFRLINDTINANVSTGNGIAGGVDVGSSDSALLLNTIVAGNSGQAIADCSSGVAGSVAAAFTLIGVDTPGASSCGLTNGVAGNLVGTVAAPLNPRLSALTANGGPTRTEADPLGSPENASGDATSCLASPVNGLDQRGISRNASNRGRCDIGAYDTATSPF